MVDDVVHVVGLELVQDGDDDSPVCDSGKERHAPVSAVPSAQCDFVAGFDVGRFEHQVDFGNLPCHVFILQAFPVEVRESLAVPVCFDTGFNELD